MKLKTNRWILVGILLLTFMLLTACSGPDEHIWLKSSGWSRAVFLGNTAFNDPVSLTLDDEGQIYFVLLSSNEEKTKTTINLVALDQGGRVRWEKLLDEFTLSRPDKTQIIWEKESLRLFWIDNGGLYTLLLDAQGVPLQNEPILLSAEVEVDAYSFAIDASGEVDVWFAGARKTPGVYALSVSDGRDEVISVDPEGIRPELRYDDEGTLHAAWLQYPIGYGKTRLYYGAYPQGVAVENVESQVVHELTIAPSNSLEGSVMGIDKNNVYIFWTEKLRTGIESGATKTTYLYFPLGDPARAPVPKLIKMPSVYDLEFEYFPDSALKTGERISLQESTSLKTDKIQEIRPNPVQADEMAIVFRSPTQYLWRKVKEQVNMAYFYEGEPSSYQPLSFTTTLSTSPNILNSPDRHLYVTWLEKVETDWYAVYFASTAPAIEEALSHSTSRELGRVAAQMIFGILVGILLAPIAAGVWMVAPLGALFITSPLRKIGSNHTRDIFTWISLALAVFAFWLGKLATLPGMMDYVPFSAWIPEISHFWAEILRWAVPLIFMLFSLFVAWYHTYRVGNKTSLYFLLIYIGVDSLLTAAVYAVLIYGTI